METGTRSVTTIPKSWTGDSPHVTQRRYFTYGILHFIDGTEISMRRRYTQFNNEYVSSPMDYSITFRFHGMLSNREERDVLERRSFDSVRKRKHSQKDERGTHSFSSSSSSSSFSSCESISSRETISADDHHHEERGLLHEKEEEIEEMEEISNDEYVFEVVLYESDVRWEEGNVAPAYIVRSQPLRKIEIWEMLKEIEITKTQSSEHIQRNGNEIESDWEGWESWTCAII